MIRLGDHHPFDDKNEAASMEKRNHFSAYAEVQVRSILYQGTILRSSPSALSLHLCYGQFAANQCSIFSPISSYFSGKNHFVLLHVYQFTLKNPEGIYYDSADNCAKL